MSETTYALLKRLAGTILISVAVVLVTTFASFVLAQEHIKEATTIIVTATGIAGLLSGICVNYAPNLRGKEKDEVIKCGEFFLMACLLLIIGLSVKYGFDIIEQNSLVKESSTLITNLSKYGVLLTKAFFLFSVILALAGAKHLFLHLFRRLKIEEAWSPQLRKACVVLFLVIFIIFAVWIGVLALLHLIS